MAPVTTSCHRHILSHGSNLHCAHVSFAHWIFASIIWMLQELIKFVCALAPLYACWYLWRCQNEAKMLSPGLIRACQYVFSASCRWLWACKTMARLFTSGCVWLDVFSFLVKTWNLSHRPIFYISLRWCWTCNTVARISVDKYMNTQLHC